MSLGQPIHHHQCHTPCSVHNKDFSSKCWTSSMSWIHLEVAQEGCETFWNLNIWDRSDCIWTGSVSSFTEDWRDNLPVAGMLTIQEIGDSNYRVLAAKGATELLPPRERSASRTADNVTVLGSATLSAGVKEVLKKKKEKKRSVVQLRVLYDSTGASRHGSKGCGSCERAEQGACHRWWCGLPWCHCESSS